jgi:PAS domain S-box-containing protein
VTTPVCILVVDDQPNNRLALQAILSSPEYRVLEAASGRDALRILLHEEVAVVLTDVVMPEMSGFELAAAIKERARTAGIPIIFLTAEATDLDLIYKGYRVGAVDYMTKPLVPEIVRAKVAVFAEVYRQRKRIEAQAELLVEAERREHQHRLTELQLASERRYRTLAEAVPHIVWTTRPDGSIDYFNQRWFEYTGVSAEQAAGSWEGSVHPGDVSACTAAWREALRTSQMFQAECRLRRSSDGTHRWHLGRGIPERGPSGQIVSWLGTFTDIDDQKQAQAVLAEFKATLDAVIDAVMIFDPEDWRFLYANHGASVLLGYRGDELLRMRPVDFMAEHDDRQLRQLLAPLREGRSDAVTIETKFRRRDTRMIPVEVSLQKIGPDRGRIVAIARDITERKRAQLERELLYREAVEAIGARDEFLSVASHELRNPLTSLKLQIEMLLAPELVLPAEQLKAKLEIVARQVDRMTMLVSELMDVSRITAGRLRLETEELDLSALVRDVITRHAADATKARCTVDLRASGPVIGRWDRMRLEQVTTNLLTNAFKFGAGKPIELTVEQDGPMGRLVVADHGIGIAADDLERIFHRYEQARSTPQRSGLGLGLYIVRQLVEAHGGAIHVESQPGAGSTFTVELPREAVPETAQPRAAAEHHERSA